MLELCCHPDVLWQCCPGGIRAASDEQVTLLAAGKGVRSVVLRLPMYVWGNGGSYFIPLNIGVAKEHGKAYYILPGMHLKPRSLRIYFMPP